MTTTEPRRYTREIPLDGSSGYAPTAVQAGRITAAYVREGDILLLDGYVSRVSRVTVLSLGTGADLSAQSAGLTRQEILKKFGSTPLWPVLHITGDINIIRGPHELLSVIRETAPVDQRGAWWSHTGYYPNDFGRCIQCGADRAELCMSSGTPSVPKREPHFYRSAVGVNEPPPGFTAVRDEPEYADSAAPVDPPRSAGHHPIA